MSLIIAAYSWLTNPNPKSPKIKPPRQVDIPNARIRCMGIFDKNLRLRQQEASALLASAPMASASKASAPKAFALHTTSPSLSLTLIPLQCQDLEAAMHRHHTAFKEADLFEEAHALIDIWHTNVDGPLLYVVLIRSPSPQQLGGFRQKLLITTCKHLALA
jgi:hypothetical protein